MITRVQSNRQLFLGPDGLAYIQFESVVEYQKRTDVKLILSAGLYAVPEGFQRTYYEHSERGETESTFRTIDREVRQV